MFLLATMTGTGPQPHVLFQVHGEWCLALCVHSSSRGRGFVSRLSRPRSANWRVHSDWQFIFLRRLALTRRRGRSGNGPTAVAGRGGGTADVHFPAVLLLRASGTRCDPAPGTGQSRSAGPLMAGCCTIQGSHKKDLIHLHPSAASAIPTSTKPHAGCPPSNHRTPGRVALSHPTGQKRL